MSLLPPPFPLPASLIHEIPFTLLKDLMPCFLSLSVDPLLLLVGAEDASQLQIKSFFLVRVRAVSVTRRAVKVPMFYVVLLTSLLRCVMLRGGYHCFLEGWVQFSCCHVPPAETFLRYRIQRPTFVIIS